MIQVYPDADALARAVADLFVEQAGEAVAARGRFAVALSGGSTPRRSYEYLAQPPWRDRVDWSRAHLFWGDERCVPGDDPRSNYRMTREALLDHVPLPAENVHAVRGELSPADGAKAYRATLQEFFGSDPPAFDLVILGLGTNGHTASLFPGTPAPKETERWAVEVYVAEQDLWRVTLTAPLLNRAGVTAFLVAGADKAEVLQEVLHGPRQPDRLPAQLIRPEDGRLLWLLDAPAAARLQPRP